MCSNKNPCFISTDSWCFIIRHSCMWFRAGLGGLLSWPSGFLSFPNMIKLKKMMIKLKKDHFFCKWWKISTSDWYFSDWASPFALTKEKIIFPDIKGFIYSSHWVSLKVTRLPNINVLNIVISIDYQTWNQFHNLTLFT